MAVCSLLAIKSASATDIVLLLIICTLLHNTLTLMKNLDDNDIMIDTTFNAYLLIKNKHQSVIENVIVMITSQVIVTTLISNCSLNVVPLQCT